MSNHLQRDLAHLHRLATGLALAGVLGIGGCGNPGEGTIQVSPEARARLSPPVPVLTRGPKARLVGERPIGGAERATHLSKDRPPLTRYGWPLLSYCCPGVRTSRSATIPSATSWTRSIAGRMTPRRASPAESPTGIPPMWSSPELGSLSTRPFRLATAPRSSAPTTIKDGICSPLAD